MRMPNQSEGDSERMSKFIRTAYAGQFPPADIDSRYDVLLYANESPYNIAEEVLGSEGLEKITSLCFNRYPDCEAKELRKAYGRFLGGISPENIAAGNGSDELIRVTGDVFLDPGDVMISCEPAFSVYRRSAEIARARYIGLHSQHEYMHPDISALIGLSEREKAKVIIICSPHNPTGYVWKQADILRVVDETDALVVVDEAYIDFADTESMAKTAVNNEKLIVLRTMSKAFSLAALRIGFACGTAENIRALNCGTDMYNINSFSQALAVIMLENSSKVFRQIDIIKKEKDRVFDELGRINGIKAFPSGANFILTECSFAGETAQLAEMRNILLRFYRENPSLIRLSIGNKEENDRLLAVIKEAADENMQN